MARRAKPTPPRIGATNYNSFAMADLPTHFGRYRIQDELGRGAMGAVYRALDPTIERMVAVKTIHVDLPAAELADYRDRFLKEAKAAGRLSHPNIVTIFDAGEEAGVAYIVMEYLAGAALRDLITPGEPLPLDVWTSIAAQVADGLAAAHAAGVIHRDIKPGNVMLTEDARVRITDFGIARSGGTTSTQAGLVLGSPRYMSPEQIQGFPLDQRSDLFSLGALMYEMATGRAPFGANGSDVFEVMREVVNREPPVPRTLNAELPAALEAIILRALAKRPDQRYRSATLIVRDLKDTLKQLLPEATLARAAAVDGTVRLVRRATSVRSGVDPTADTVPRPQRAALAVEASGQVWDVVQSQLLADIDAFAAAAPVAPPAVPGPARATGASHRAYPSLAAEMFEPDPDLAAQVARSSLLDELADEASRRRSGTRPAPGTSDLLTPAIGALDAEMRRLFSYLNDFIRHLNTINPPVPRVFPFLDIASIKGLEWQRGFADYRTRAVSGQPIITRLTLSWTLAGVGHFEVEREGPAIERMRTRLFENRLRFAEEELRNARGLVERVRFQVFHEINAGAVFVCDETGRGVRLATGNLERFGRVDYLLTPELLGAGLYDEFGKLVLAKPSRFFAYAELAAPEALG
jgi:serine/threonine-protein kinase